MDRRAYFALSFAWIIAALAAAQPLPLHEIGLFPGDSGIAAATSSQQDHSVAMGDGQYLVAWSDYRGRSSGSQTIQSDGDIFGIRLDAQGIPIEEAPFMIAGGMGLQQRPLVAWNGEAWLVLYISQDPVGGYYEDRLRAVRVSPQGLILDATPILFPPTQFTPNTIGLQVSGQDGQWLVTRCIYHASGYGTFLAGQRIGGEGVLLDAVPIMLMDWVYGQTRSIVAGGEYLVAGPDWNTDEIKARRVGLDGQPVASAFNLPSLNLASSGSEYYVVWIAGFVNLVGSRVTLSGSLLTPAGTPIVENFSQYNQSTLTHDGTNWWLEWGVSDQLHTVRIDAGGTVLDPGGGVLLPIAIGGNINTAYNPLLVPQAGSGGVHLFWYDLRVALGYDANVFALPISAANVPGTERCISTGTTSQRNPDLSSGPDGTVAMVFVSEAANDDRVLVQMLADSGVPALPEPIEVYRGPTVGKAGIAWNGSIFMVAWDQGASGLSPTQIMARRMNADGSFVDEVPFAVMPGFNADIESLGEDFLVAGARFAAYPQFIDLVAARIDGPTGALLDGPIGMLLGGNYVNGMPRVRSDGTKWLVAAHSMWSHDSSQGDAILATVPPAGPPTPAFNPTPVAGGSGDLDIAYSGSKYLLVWRMNSLANANNYVAGRIMNANGTFPPGYFTIAEAPGRQLRPTVAWDGSTFVIAWDDQRNQQSFFDARTDVYGARVSETGTVLDPQAFPIQSGVHGEASPAILSRPDGVSFVVSTRFVTSPPLDSYRVGLTVLGLETIPGDLDGDGAVGIIDFLALLAAWGPCPPALCPADLDADGAVGIVDFLILLGNWTA